MTRTLRIVVTKKARARSSSRNRVSMNSNIVSTQRPPIEIRASSAIRPTSDACLGSSSASAIGVANGSAISGADRGEPEEPGEGAGDDPLGVLAVLVIEAQQRLDQAEADDDAGGDDRREHHLGGAVVGRGQVARVERQQRDRDELRDDARRRVGGAGRRQAAQVSRHGSRAYAGSRTAGAAARQRGADGEQHPGDRVLEEAGVGQRVDQERDEGCKNRRTCLRAAQESGAARCPEAMVQRATTMSARRGAKPKRPCSASDGDRLGVGDGDGDVFVGSVVAVGVLEGAGAVALDGAFGEEVEAAGDEVAAAAEVDVEAVGGELAGAADEDDRQGRADHADGDRGQGPLPAPADRGEDGQAGQQGDEARLREGLGQAEPEEGDEERQQRELRVAPAPTAAPPSRPRSPAPGSARRRWGPRRPS